MKPATLVVLAGAVLALTAAAAAAEPNFSGVWENRSGVLMTPREQMPQPFSVNGKQSPPYNAEYQARYDALHRQLLESGPADPAATCLPVGMPRLMIMPYPMEVTQVAGRINFFSEIDTGIHRVYLDGRKFPSRLAPTYYGYAIGRWEGDVLVVETRGLRGESVLDATAMPHSDAMWVSERIYLAGPDTLKNEMTMHDPKALTRPWTVVREYRRAKTEILETFCLENPRNPADADGNIGVILTTPDK